MSTLNDDGKVRFGGWPEGINNVDHVTKLSPGQLRDSENFIYDAAGVPSLRPGFERVITSSGHCHSLWTNDTIGIYFDDGALIKVDPASLETVQLATGYGNRAFSYAQIGSRLFFSNEEISGRLDLDTLEVLPGLGTTTPELEVTVTAGSIGVLPAGSYWAGVAYEDVNGEESGVPRMYRVTLPMPGGFTVAWSGPRPAGADFIRVYSTGTPDANLQEAHSYSRVSKDFASEVVMSPPRGRQLRTYLMETMPHCRYLTAYNGHLYGAVGNELIYSIPRRYGLYDPDTGHLGKFPQNISVLEHYAGGIFVSADKTYRYAGPVPGEMTYHDDLFNYPGVPGSGKQVEASIFEMEGLGSQDVPVWFTSRGLVLGAPDGSVISLMKGKAEPGLYNRAVTGLVTLEGQPQLVTALREKKLDDNSFGIAERSSYRIVKNGLDDPI